MTTSPFRPVTARDFAHVRAARDDYWQWLAHVMPAAGCTRPVRLLGEIVHVRVHDGAGEIFAVRDTATMPDGVIYKACGNRRESVCPSCAGIYQRDAYQLVRAGLVGGKGVPETVATHPAVFVTLTAPSFGPVHTRPVTQHTCANRRRCDCRPRPCHPGRDAPCPHGNPAVCFVRHESDDPRLGVPLCLDCYQYDRHAVWNSRAGELWRRTTMAITRSLRRTARRRGLDPTRLRIGFGKVAEMQRRAAVHFHAIIRLDGADPDDPTTVLPPPAELGLIDLADAVDHAAKTVMFITDPHPTMPNGWLIGWGTQTDIRTINVGEGDTITDGMVAGYLAKYATKGTEATGHTSARLNHETIDLYADPDGTHTERLVEACWRLGAPDPRLTTAEEQRERPYRPLRRWAHMLGFGGHFLTKSRHYSVTFRVLRDNRIVYRRTLTTGPDATQPTDTPTVLVVNFLSFVGAGWHNTGDAMLANSAAAAARERARIGREELTTQT